MDHLIPSCTVATHFVFRDLARECRLTIPADNLKFLTRLEVVVHGMPELDSGHGVNDLRVQLNGRDITASIRDGLAAKLSAVADFKGAYQRAMTDWLDYRASFGVLDQWLKGERSAAEALAEKAPVDLMRQLGDKKSGFDGELDVFNFLFRAIPVEPIIIPASALPAADLARPLCFIVSSGPSRMVNPAAWSPDLSHGHGGVYCEIRGVLSDPLVASVEQLLKLQTDLDQFMNTVKIRLLNIHKLLGIDTDGKIQPEIARQNDVINTLTLSLADVGKLVKAQTPEIDHMKRQLDEIRSRVERL